MRLSTEIVGKNNSEASQIGGKLNIQFGGRFLDKEVSSQSIGQYSDAFKHTMVHCNSRHQGCFVVGFVSTTLIGGEA